MHSPSVYIWSRLKQTGPECLLVQEQCKEGKEGGWSLSGLMFRTSRDPSSDLLCGKLQAPSIETILLTIIHVYRVGQW